jgi:hypothetical protein
MFFCVRNEFKSYLQNHSNTYKSIYRIDVVGISELNRIKNTLSDERKLNTTHKKITIRKN